MKDITIETEEAVDTLWNMERLEILLLLLELPHLPAVRAMVERQPRYGTLWRDPFTVGLVLDQCYRRRLLHRPRKRDREACRRNLSKIFDALELSNLWHVRETHDPFDETLSAREMTSMNIATVWHHTCNVEDLGEVPNPSSKLDGFQCREMSLVLLREVGNLRVQWTAHITEHLTLDPESLTLQIFWFGFAAMACPITHTGSKGNAHFHAYPSNSHMLRELSATYSLLFRSQANTPREDLAEYGLLPVPEWLRVFYGSERGPLPIQDAPNMSYFLQEGKHRVSDIEYHLRDINSKVPPTQLFERYKIWGDRLKQLKAYMDSQKPGGIRRLWADKRDSLQWYTFWAVIIVGGARVLLSILGLMVSIVQTVGTFKGLE